VPKFYIDGQSVGNENPGAPRQARIAIAHRPEAAQRYFTPTRIVTEEIGDRTNNEAEYHALLRLLQLLTIRINSGHPQVADEGIWVYSDSEVLVKQLSGEYRVKEERLRKLWKEAKELMEEIDSVHVQHVPREENLAGLWLEGKIEGREMAPEEFLSDL
jgi:ribonuclease HI